MSRVELVKTMDHLLQHREPFAVVTVVRVEGSGLGEPGLKEIISGGGRVVCGSLGEVCPDSAIADVALRTL
jgi:xanthine/CO dehydrogenase XdhC/CoxF family maturation factor